MLVRSMIAAALLIPVSIAAADEPASTQQKQYLDHMNRILELATEQQERCLKAKSVHDCTASDEFSEMVDMMYQGMLTSPGEWPQDYFEALKRGDSPTSMEEMLERYRRGAPSPSSKKGKGEGEGDNTKTTDSETI